MATRTHPMVNHNFKNLRGLMILSFLLPIGYSTIMDKGKDKKDHGDGDRSYDNGKCLELLLPALL